jgi:hypothetical protein
MSGGPTYRLITTKFRGISPSGNAIFVDPPDSRGGVTVSIPRSLIHGADDLKMGRYSEGDEITIRVMEFKAEEIGFA